MILSAVRPFQRPQFEARRAGLSTIELCGRQVGKTYGFELSVIDDLMRHATDPMKYRIFFGGPILMHVKEPFERICAKLDALKMPYFPRRTHPYEIHCQSATCKFQSMERPDSLPGPTYNAIYIDEATIVKHVAFERLQPTGVVHDAPVHLAGTPRGAGNWVTVLYKRGGFTNFTVPTWKNNAISIDAYRRLADSFSGRIGRQELLAEILADTGSVFRLERVPHWSGILTPADRASGEMVVAIGADVASKEDYTVLAPITNRGRILTIQGRRWTRIEWAMVNTKIKQITDEFPNATLILDATGVGDQTFQELRKVIRKIDAVKFTNEKKNRMVTDLELAMEQGKVTIPTDPALFEEFKNYDYRMSESGRTKYGAPEGYHDDIVTACFLAYKGLTETRFESPTVEPINATNNRRREVA